MSTTELRRKIKKEIDRLPPARLESLADYIGYLSRPPLPQRIAAAEKAIASGTGTNWRKVHGPRPFPQRSRRRSVRPAVRRRGA